MNGHDSSTQGRSTHSPRRPRRRQGENRERLLDAGIIEFASKGYYGSSTAAIATRADVPQPHVYANFRTKQELFLACAARVHDSVIDPGIAGKSHSSSQDEQIARFVYQLVALLEDPSLGQQVRKIAHYLRGALGEQRFDALLLRGGHSLLG